MNALSVVLKTCVSDAGMVQGVVNQGRQIDTWLYSTNKALFTVNKRIK